MTRDGGPVPDGRARRNVEATVGTPEGALERARAMATLLDESIRVPGLGYRVGLDPLLGVVPVGGDVVAAAASLYVVAEAANAGVPSRTLARMVALVAVDLVVGSIPVVGTLFDAVWKANRWNVAALERHVERGRAADAPVESAAAGGS